MARSTFEVWTFKVLDGYEIHFGKDPEGFWFYEIQDLETLAIVDVKDGLTEAEILGAVGCAMDPFQLLRFQQVVRSL